MKTKAMFIYSLTVAVSIATEQEIKDKFIDYCEKLGSDTKRHDYGCPLITYDDENPDVPLYQD